MRKISLIFFIAAALFYNALNLQWDNPAELEANIMRFVLLTACLVIGVFFLIFARRNGQAKARERKTKHPRQERRNEQDPPRYSDDNPQGREGSGIYGRSNWPMMASHPRDWTGEAEDMKKSRAAKRTTSGMIVYHNPPEEPH